MISIIITAFKEPDTIGMAIESFLHQDIKEEYEIIVSCPDEETSKIVKDYSKKFRQVKRYKDPGQGKMLALNLMLEKVKGNIIIISDGDVYVDNKSINKLLDAFKDENVGCISGRPVSLNSRNNLLGYWSHLLLDAGAHWTRLQRSKKEKYITCTGYLIAFRNNIIKSFPRDVPEDAVIPFIFMEKGYKIKYVPEAKVFIKYPTTINDWIEQKKRVSKAYQNLKKIRVNGKKVPMMKSFLNEVFYGWYKALSYPNTIKEFYWSLLLFPARLYMWILTFIEADIKKDVHRDSWKRVESTK